MNCKKILQILGVLSVLIMSPALGENIDPYEEGSRYAYGENVGWLNFKPNQGDGAHVSSTNVQGFVWAENIGWVNLSPAGYGGVVNDGAGNLSGYAWGENVGWINFNPTVSGDLNHYGVTIDAEGNFAGWAWGENIGWINFNSAQLFDKGVRACIVAFDDLANFVDDWLSADPTSPANLISPDGVDGRDYAAFASRWRDFCPDGWQLK